MADIWDRLKEVSRQQRRRQSPKAARRVTPAADRAVTRAARTVGTTTRRATPRITRSVTRAARQAPTGPPSSRDLDEAFERAQRRSGRAVRGPVERLIGVRQQGFDPTRLRGTSGSSILANFAGDVIDTITGIPSAAQLGARAIAYPAVLGLEATGGIEPGYSDRIERDIKNAGRSIKDDYSYRYGDLVAAYTDIAAGRDPRANLREFGSKAAEHPGLLAMDVASAASLAGGAVRGGARIGARMTTGQASRRLARLGSKSILPGSARYRAPKIRTVEMGENTAKGLRGRAVASVEIPRRPYSANPITRGIQRVAEGPATAVARRLERAADDGNRALAPLSKQSKFNRSVATRARDFRMDADMARVKALRVETRDYVNAVRELDRSGLGTLARKGASKWSKDQVDAALFLHGRDLLDVPGMTPAQARARVVQFMREGLDDAVTKSGSKSKGAQQTIEAIAKVPDELLDLKKAPESLRRAVDEYRKLATSATESRIKAGTIAPETAENVRRRSAQAVFEDVHFNQKTGLWTSPRNPYTPVGKRGVYTPDLPVDPLKKGRAGDPSGAFGRMTQDKVRQSHGTLFRRGNVSTDRGLPIKALERAIVDREHPRFVKDFYDTFAFRRPNGKLATGKRARLAMEADPDNVVLLSQRSLEDAMRMARELPEGEMPDNPLRGVEMYEGAEGLARAKQLGEKGDLVAFPKAAVDGMRQGWDGIAGGRIKAFDTPQHLWKRGILAFAPRWYVNSLVGNTLQYGLLTGGDIRSLMQARRIKGIGDIVPERLSGSTNVAEARIAGLSSAPKSRAMRAFVRVSDRGMDFQAKIDALFRRAAYINRMKRGLRDEGGRFRKLSNDELLRAIDEAPMELKNQAIREAELFMGDYLRMTPFERATMRRVFPFYSWMRVIGRLMFVVPIRHPKRVAVTSAVARASAEVVNPDDPMQRILANRGRINIGDLSMRTAGANPFFTHADLIKNVAGGDLKGTAGTLASNLSPIGLQQFARIYSGTTAFGAPVTYPPGYGGTAAQYGRSTQRIDPVTGLPDYYEPSVPLSEQLLQTVPLAPQIVRGLASGGRQPYDVTTTMDLLTRSKPDSELFLPKRDRGMEPLPRIGPFLGWAGLNFQRRDPRVEAQQYRRALQDFREAVRQTERRKRRSR